MAFNNYPQGPFWNFIHGFGHQGTDQGAGVDWPAPGSSMPVQFPHSYSGFPFTGPACQGPRGFHHRRGRHCGPCTGVHRHDATPGTPPGPPSGEDDGEAREESPSGPRGPFGPGHRGGRGGHHDPGHRHRRYPHPPPFGVPGGFDLYAVLESLSNHPLAQGFRNYAAQAAGQSGDTLVPEEPDSENSFTPPIDIFATETKFVLHVALPGAKKEDVGVNWDSEKGVLNLAGVVYRQGDEEFLKSLRSSERKVGVFERTVKLPPGRDEKEEVDGDAITAKLEDGVLVVIVPKVEKEWTEVKRVDIE